MNQPEAASNRPLPQAERVANIDLLRGAAVMGAFYMSAVAYGLPHAAFFNLKSPGTNSSLDWVAAFVGEILFDYKAVVLLAIVYGAGVDRFETRASNAEPRDRWLATRRWVPLFLLGVPVGMHGLLWEGTPLWFLAFFTPVLRRLRKRQTKTIVAIGAAEVLLATSLAFIFNADTALEQATLGQYWVTGAKTLNDIAGGFMGYGTMLMLMGSMTIGLAFGRLGFLDADAETARSMTRYGLAVGVPLTLATLVWRELGDYEPDVAIIAEAPNMVAVIPLTLGYIGLLTRWRLGGSLRWLAARIRSVGQMALTNGAATTLFGLFALRDGGFERGYFGRAGLAVVVAAVWIVQLAASHWWMQRFRYGPLEWVLRSIVYRTRLPIRRRTAQPS